MKFANLHLHSNHSDASFTPEQLVLIGKSLGYHALALTDHETDSGVRAMMRYGKREGIDVISGCEFYGLYEGHTLHLTALDYDMENPTIRAFIDERVALECEFTRKCVERGLAKGYIEGITWDDVVRFNPDGAWLCIDSVINAYTALKLDAPSDLRQNVFRGPEVDAMKQPRPTAEEVIRAVRAADGIIALAHPYRQTQYVEGLVSLGLNGIEVSHPDNIEDTSHLAMRAAEKFGLYHCGGTDHTGAMSGCGGKLATVALQGITEEEYYMLKERRLG